MQYQGTGRPLTEAGIASVCSALDVPAPALWAVLGVETRGFGFLADRRPAILFERETFHRLTDGAFDAAHPDLSNPVSGGYVGGAAEYLRLDAAALLDHDSALWSTSWGIGQVMGFNHEIAGFADVTTMICAMVADEDTQLRVAGAFIAGSGLRAALQRQDWAAFARSYNGPAFERNSYDTRLAAAFEQYSARLPDLDVRTVQVALFYCGCAPGPVDGILGPRTGAAIRAFQAQLRLAPTGALTPELAAALYQAAWS